MPIKPKLVYWDSCVFVSAIEKTEGRYNILEKIIEEAKTNKIIIVSSTLAIAEVVKLNVIPGAKKDQTKLTADAILIRDFFENDYINIRNVDRTIAEEAASIVRL